MSNNSPKKYDEEFKKSLVMLFQNGKNRTQLSKEYGISHYKHFHSAPAPRIAQNQELASLILRIRSEHRSCFKTIYSRNSSKKLLIWSGPAILLILKPAGNGIIFASLWTYSLEKLSPGTSLRSRILLLF